MGKEAKVRFTVSVNGTERELFSVRDAATDGSLNIILRETPYWKEHGSDEVLRERNRRRYSVHKSPQSDGTTIKYTCAADGKLIEYSSYISNSKQFLLWPLFFNRQWLFEDDNILTQNKNDIIINLGEYDDRYNTLIYSIWVWDKNRQMAAFPPPIFQRGAPFRQFQIAVYFTFIPVPSILIGEALHQSTSLPRIDKGVIVHTHPDLTSYNIHDVQPAFYYFVEKLRESYMKTIRGMISDDIAFTNINNLSYEIGGIFTPPSL